MRAETIWFCSGSVWLPKNSRAWLKWSAKVSDAETQLLAFDRLPGRCEAARRGSSRGPSADQVFGS